MKLPIECLIQLKIYEHFFTERIQYQLRNCSGKNFLQQINVNEKSTQIQLYCKNLIIQLNDYFINMIYLSWPFTYSTRLKSFILMHW